jgi:hypothetical protein
VKARIAAWIAPVVLVVALWNGSLDVRPNDVESASFWAVVLVACTLPPLAVPSLGIRAWAAIHLVVALALAAWMIDSTADHDAYTDTAAVIFVPVELALVISLVAIAIVVQRRPMAA